MNDVAIQSLAGHSLNLGTLGVTGFVDGEAFTIEEGGETWTVHQGTHGNVCFSLHPNHTGTMVIRLFKTSPANKYIADLYQKQKANTIGLLSMGLRDNFGELRVSCSKCVIQKHAPISIANEPGQREWTLLLANPSVDEGSTTA
jgi:hypothetical protein